MVWDVTDYIWINYFTNRWSQVAFRLIEDYHSGGDFKIAE